MAKVTLNFFRNYFSNFVIVIILGVLFFAGTLAETVFVSLNVNNKVYYNGNLDSNNISIMVNVYWGTEFIEPMLEIFKKYNAKVTFFVGGCWVSKNADILKLVSDCGHEIANHGYFHKDHKNLSAQQNKDEIILNHKLVKATINKDMMLFAPPSGSYSQTTLKVASSIGYKTIMWTKDTIDWRDKDSNLIYKRATKNPKGGDLILMHPTKCTLEALDDILSFYSNNGYKLTTVSENIA